MPVFKCATVCLSNMNRSMEGHKQLHQSGFKVSSYGVGRMVMSSPLHLIRPIDLQLFQVTLPGEDRKNNVFEFGTSYKDILAKLEERGVDKCASNPALCFTIPTSIFCQERALLGQGPSKNVGTQHAHQEGPTTLAGQYRAVSGHSKYSCLNVTFICVAPRQDTFSRHDVVITFDDEVYDMVQLGECRPDC